MLAFLKNDAPGMTQQVAWSAGKPGVEDILLVQEADTAAYFGRLAKARELSRQAVASAERADEKETAAGYVALAARREALFGNPAEARRGAATALALSSGRDVQYPAAMALAIAGDAVRAQELADDLAMRYPEDTILVLEYVPVLRAEIALAKHNSLAGVEALKAAAPYEMGETAVYPVYVRGEAYLSTRQGNEAVVEFQKILDHRGIVLNEPIGALARLQIGRAYAMAADTAKAKAAYQDFLTLWKDADPDIPILKQAKAEYAKLQ
jgi:hypothetical protein